MSLGDLAVIVAAGLAGPLLAASRRVFVPVVAGEILAGVVLGRSGLDVIHAENATVSFLAQAGFAMLMLTVGMHIPLRDRRLRRAFGRGALAAGVAASRRRARWVGRGRADRDRPCRGVRRRSGLGFGGDRAAHVAGTKARRRGGAGRHRPGHGRRRDGDPRRSSGAAAEPGRRRRTRWPAHRRVCADRLLRRPLTSPPPLGSPSAQALQASRLGPGSAAGAGGALRPGVDRAGKRCQRASRWVRHGPCRGRDRRTEAPVGSGPRHRGRASSSHCSSSCSARGWTSAHWSTTRICCS